MRPNPRISQITTDELLVVQESGGVGHRMLACSAAPEDGRLRLHIPKQEKSRLSPLKDVHTTGLGDVGIRNRRTRRQRTDRVPRWAWVFVVLSLGLSVLSGILSEWAANRPDQLPEPLQPIAEDPWLPLLIVVGAMIVVGVLALRDRRGEPQAAMQADIQRLQQATDSSLEALSRHAGLVAPEGPVRLPRTTLSAELAAAGGNLVVTGSPGSGKSALLRELAVTLRERTEDVVLLTTEDLPGSARTSPQLPRPAERRDRCAHRLDRLLLWDSYLGRAGRNARGGRERLAAEACQRPGIHPLAGRRQYPAVRPASQSRLAGSVPGQAGLNRCPPPRPAPGQCAAPPGQRPHRRRTGRATNAKRAACRPAR
jgi:hypothetical protein